MDRLAQLIEETTDVRELKRARSVKLGEEGMTTEAIGAVLQVTAYFTEFGSWPLLVIIF